MKKVVYLQIYEGKELLFKGNGQVTNQNQIVTLNYPTQEWDNYMRHLSSSGFCKVEIVKVMNEIVKDGQYSYSKCDEFEDLKKIVENQLNKKDEIPLTPEQMEIKELKKQMAELIKKEKPNFTESFEDLKKQYEEKFGKKPHHMIKAKKLKELINKS